MKFLFENLKPLFLMSTVPYPSHDVNILISYESVTITIPNIHSSGENGVT